MSPDMIPSDLVFKIKIKEHETFQLIGSDLIFVKRISLIEGLKC
jgi:DnaJ-class molecular chaperone